VDEKEIGRLFAKIGGRARAAKLSPEQRSKIASAGGRAKWDAMTPEQREEHLARMRDAAAAKRKDK